MVSLDTVQADNSRSSIINDPTSSPRLSFSAEFLDDTNSFITISPTSPNNSRGSPAGAADFEFLSATNSLSSAGAAMIGADELFFEGKLLPFWQHQSHHADHINKLARINLNVADDIKKLPEKPQNDDVEAVMIKDVGAENNSATTRAVGTTSTTTTWFVDDDPSPRPPKCTVLWKELLRLKKQRAASALSPSSSTSSSSSSSSAEAESRHGKHHHHHSGGGKGTVRRGLERTRSATIRIRPMINVPICTQVKTSVVATTHYALPPLFPLKKGKLER